MSVNGLTFVSERVVRETISVDDLMSLQDSAFREISGSPAAISAVASYPTGSIVAMPAWYSSGPALGAKLLTATPGNSGGDVPVNQALILMFDPESGRPEAILDGTWITSARTGAAAALAARVLAAPDADTLAVLGGGPVAEWAIRCTARVRSLRHVHVWSRSVRRAQQLASLVREDEALADVAVDVKGSPQDAVDRAAIVVTATSSEIPLFDGRDLESGCHVSVMGGSDGGREIDLGTVPHLRLVMDSWHSAWLRAGIVELARSEGAVTESDVVGELGSVLLGTIEGRTSPSDITVFVSSGVGMQDIAVAHEVLSRLSSYQDLPRPSSS